MSQQPHDHQHGLQTSKPISTGRNDGDGEMPPGSAVVIPDFASRVLEAMSEAVIAADFDGNIIYWNPAAEQFYGWTIDEALGHSVLDMMSSDDARTRAVNTLNTMRDRDTWTRELTVRRKDGTAFPAEVTLSQLRDGHGEVIGIVGVSTDITGRKQAEDALVASEARMGRLEESNLLGIIRADDNGNLYEANDAFLDMLGFTRDDLNHGLRWDVLTPEEYRAIDKQIIDDLLSTGVSAPKEKEYFHKDGSRVPVLIGCARLESTAHDVIAFVLDISRRKRAEQEHETLLHREQMARFEANSAQRRAEQLLQITAAYSRARTPDEVIQVTIDQGLAALEAHAGVIALLNDADDGLEIKQTTGYPDEVLEPWKLRAIPLVADFPITDAVLNKESVWIRSREELIERYPAIGAFESTYSGGSASLPLMVNGQTLGALGLSFASEHDFSPAERVFAETLSRLCAQALERTYLFAGERDARVAAEESQQRLALLAEASDLLATSLDVADTLTATAELIVPHMADWCVIDIVDNRGIPERITVAHVDPEKVRWAEELQKRYPYNPNAEGGLAAVLRSGQSQIYPTVTDEMLAAGAQDAEHLEIVRAVGFSSAILVPMIARGRTIGAISLVHAESGRHYTDDDVALVENLAYRAGMAIDSARLFEQAQSHAVRMDTLADVSQGMAEANLDLAALLETVSLQVSRLIGDFVVIRTPSEDGKWLNPVAIHHPDPNAEAALHEMFSDSPLRWNEGITGQVATSGESLLIPETTPEQILSRMKPAYRPWTETFGMYSVLIVPMRRRQKVVGTIASFRITPDQPYTESDRQFVQELADRAALAVENAQLYREAQEAIRLREEFLSIASHELRTPLTTITGFAHLLTRYLGRDPIDRGRIDTVTHRLLDEAQRMNQLVGDLLDMSRVQQGRLDLRLEEVDLADLAGRVASRLHDTQERSNRRDIIVDASQPVVGNWDPTRIDQVLTNLVSNALKYSEGEIRVTVDIDGDSAVLAVSDQGVGIPLDQQARLFEPFIRGDAAHHSSGGSGLGLYITRQIVEHHDGTITLTSQPNDGSTFTVRLPLQPAEQ